MVFLHTATVNPSNRVSDLAVNSADDRLKQYRDSLEFCINNIPSVKMVFCDNSGFDTSEMNDLVTLAKEKGCLIELLSFKGNTEETVRHGKGYGESEIVSYALSNSRLIREDNDQYYIKMTGRLFVDNIASIITKIQKSIIKSRIDQASARDTVFINATDDGKGAIVADTRIYSMSIDTYKKYWANAGEQVDDSKGDYLERVFINTIRQNGLKSRNLPEFPRITGVSGSNGYQYSYNEFKCRIKDILSVFNYYGIR